MCSGSQVIVNDYVQSEDVLKASRMHDELDLDGELHCCILVQAGVLAGDPWHCQPQDLAPRLRALSHRPQAASRLLQVI